MADPLQLRLPLGDRPRLKPGSVAGCAPFGTTHDCYDVWAMMIRRCENPKNESFVRYGGKGIRVCDRWRYSFADFCDDMGPRPEGFTIDRIDPAKDYEPGNCRWLSHADNASRSYREGEDFKPFAVVSRELGGRSAMVSERIVCGWCHQCATTVPKGQPRPKGCKSCAAKQAKKS